MTMYVPLLEVQVTPNLDFSNFCYKNNFIKKTTGKRLAREKNLTLRLLNSEFKATVQDETFTLSKELFESVSDKSKAGGYCNGTVDPHFNPIMVKGNHNICYNSFDEMFYSLFEVASVVKGRVVDVQEFEF